MATLHKFSSASSKDCAQLSALTKRSKAHWGYPKEQMMLWDAELTITPMYLDEYEVIMFKEKNVLMGYYSWKEQDEYSAYLDNFFVEPNCIQQGIGSQLLQHFLATIRANHYTKIELISDPNATAFYVKNGFDIVGVTHSSIPGRNLSCLQLQL